MKVQRKHVGWILSISILIIALIVSIVCICIPHEQETPTQDSPNQADVHVQDINPESEKENMTQQSSQGFSLDTSLSFDDNGFRTQAPQE